MPNKANMVRLDEFYKHDCYVERCFISYLLFWHDNRANQVNVHKN